MEPKKRTYLKFFMPMHPPTVTDQERGVNYKTKTHYKRTEVKAAHAKLKAYLAPHRPEKPITGPVSVEIGWLFYNEQKEELGWNISKPDLDNIEKGLFDCMTELGFWRDDKQICQKYTEKRWTQQVPGIAITVEELE